MPSSILANASPFDCRWIVRRSEHVFVAGGPWKYAVCARFRNADRVVNECDCSRCARWEPPDGREDDEPLLPPTSRREI